MSARDDYPPIPNGVNVPGGWGLLHLRMCDEIDRLRSDLHASHQGCFWALPHRDRHQCDCICALPRGHDGRHYCQVQLDEFAASLIAEGVTE